MKVFRQNLRLTFPSLSLIILITLNVIILKLPLLQILGYEFSVVNAILLYLFGGLNSIYESRGFEVIEFKLEKIWHGRKRYFITLITVPFFMGLASSVLFPQCPLFEGILFYIVITVPAYVLGISVGIYSDAISRKYSYLIFILDFIVLLIFPLRELFFNPQVYFYNPLFGYFPGTIYDEGIRITRLLIAYRILNCSLAILIVYLTSLIQHKKLLVKVSSLVGILLLVTIFSLIKPAMHLSTDKSSLNKNLQSSIQTEGFIIHFSSKTKFVNTRYLALLHEYYLDQLKIQMNESFHKKIDSYIFQNREEKQELMGAGNANVAKPWLRQIYLNDGSYEETLKHELVHIIAGDFGVTPLKVAHNLNSAMIEGLAVAIDNNYDAWPVHHLAKLAWQSNYRISITTLFEGANFFSQTSSLSYIYAGSFIRYLIENFGLQKVKRLYGTLDFEKLYGKNINQLAEDYYHFLENYQIDSNRCQAQLYFGSKPIFKKYCPRLAANETREANRYLSENKFDSALELFKKVYSYSHSYASLMGIIRTLAIEKKYSEAAEYLKNEIANFKTDQNYFIFELMLGDNLLESNQYESALAEYDSLQHQNPHPEYLNEVLIRKTLFSQGADSLKLFLNSPDSLKLKRLIRLNEKEIRYFCIPRIIALAERTRSNISVFLGNVRERLIVEDYQSSCAALEMSKYFLRRMDLENAQFFAIKAVHVNLDPDRKHVFLENLRMVNWFKNFSNEVKVN